MKARLKGRSWWRGYSGQQLLSTQVAVAEAKRHIVPEWPRTVEVMADGEVVTFLVSRRVTYDYEVMEES